MIAAFFVLEFTMAIQQSQLYAAIGRLLNNTDHDNQTNDITALFAPPVNVQTGITYTIALSDQSCIVTLNNASAITVTVPNTLPVGFQCVLIQLGAGQVSVAAASGAGLANAHNSFKLYGQYSVGSLLTLTNSGGSSAFVIFAGDTA